MVKEEGKRRKITNSILSANKINNKHLPIKTNIIEEKSLFAKLR